MKLNEVFAKKTYPDRFDEHWATNTLQPYRDRKVQELYRDPNTSDEIADAISDVFGAMTHHEDEIDDPHFHDLTVGEMVDSL